jgi:hypothetical protein
MIFKNGISVASNLLYASDNAQTAAIPALRKWEIDRPRRLRLADIGQIVAD